MSWINILRKFGSNADYFQIGYISLSTLFLETQQSVRAPVDVRKISSADHILSRLGRSKEHKVPTLFQKLLPVVRYAQSDGGPENGVESRGPDEPEFGRSSSPIAVAVILRPDVALLSSHDIDKSFRSILRARIPSSVAERGQSRKRAGSHFRPGSRRDEDARRSCTVRRARATARGSATGFTLKVGARRGGARAVPRDPARGV